MNTNPTQHERIRADLKAYADGELVPLARFFVARHLRGCPSCREELIHMQTLSTELQESEPETAPLPSDLRASILESAPTTETEANITPEVARRQRRIARKKMVLALGGAFVFAVMTLNAVTQGGMGGSGGAVTDTSAPMSPTLGMSKNEGATSSTSQTASSAASSATGRNSGIVVGGAGAGAASAAKLGSRDETSTMFADGHVKDRALRPDGEALRAAPSAGQQAQQNETLTLSANTISGNAPVVRNSVADYMASVVPTTRAVHREGSLGVAVPNAEDASENATRIIKNAGGFVANTSLETGGGQRRTAVLDCRVPVTQFEVVVKKIGALGVVRSKSLSGEDITAQIAQSGARRQSLSQELAIAQTRLAEKEKSRKPNASDLYELRAEVRTIRIQASQARAALETLQKYGSLSSLYVSLQDGLPATATPRPASWFDSLSPTSQAAWSAFSSNARVPLQLFLWILAYSPFWVPALIIWRKYGRKWLTE